MKSLNHKNTISIRFHGCDMARLKKGTFMRHYVVMDFALGGNLYDFIFTGAFPEKVARYYFKEMINGI